MENQVRTTSLNAYTEIQAEGSAENQRLTILHFIRRYPDGLLRSEISQILGIPINAVCGRVKELLKFGTIYEDGKRINKNTHKENYVLKALIIYDKTK